MKMLEGIIVSTGMKNTAVVEVDRKTPHRLYKKLIKKSKKFKVDNTGFSDIGVGTLVRIVETRPISKNKYFKITGIIGSAKKGMEVHQEVEIPKRVRKSSSSKKKKGK